ncbi:putative receptor-like protein kinase [Acorus calamus]|uniref:non-specific serine/threonine protein kinase n=1 Tax=Acorus calamus TaxID=4465 RepID=A0AAV9D1G2_ACOCL|nr:putative receptor-like protein kinase [Acorus calamus]
MSSDSSLNGQLSEKTFLFGMKLWVVIGIGVGVSIVLILLLLVMCLSGWKKSRTVSSNPPNTQIPTVSKEIKEVRVEQVTSNDFVTHDSIPSEESDKVVLHLGMNNNHSGSFHRVDKDCSSQSGEEGSSRTINTYKPSPLTGLPEFSHLGWGHWFTLRDLELATNRFARDNVLGEGGYGVVYRGHLINGTLGQAEKEFRVEVEAIGHVRHKNLVRLLGYCVEGTQRMLVYEYVNNGNLEQWLHGAMRQRGSLTWDARIKILTGTAKAYVAPEYANTGLLNEKSDIYSFGVLLLEAITGRDPVDYSRSAHEVNLVDWLKMMVGSRRSEEVVDPDIETRPSTRALKRALLTALRCVDPDSEKRPKMSQVVRMLESDDPIPREDRRRRRNRNGSADIESQNSDTDKSDNPDSSSDNRRIRSSANK